MASKIKINRKSLLHKSNFTKNIFKTMYCLYFAKKIHSALHNPGFAYNLVM